MCGIDFTQCGTQAEEFGLVGFFILLVASFVASYFMYVAKPSPPPVDAVPVYKEIRELDRCLAKSFGFSEELQCRVKYGPW